MGNNIPAPPSGFTKRVPPPPDGFVRVQPSTANGAMDAAKSFGSGIVSGIEGAITFPADIGTWLGKKATGAIDGMMGVPDDESARRQEDARRILSQGIGPQNIAPQVSEAIGGHYQPQTMAGDYAKTLGQFLPSTIAGGGSMAKKLASAGTAAVSSETAGQLTEGTAVEPYARLAAALAGGSIPNVLERNPTTAMQKAAPSEQAVKGQRNALYDALENAGVKYDANAYGQWAKSLAQRLAKEGIDPTLHPRASAVLKRVMDGVGTSPDFAGLETLRKVAGGATRQNAMTDAADIAMASKIVSEIDNFANGAPLISNGSIPAGEVAATARQARELARRSMIARDIREMDRRSQHYLGGAESGQRNQFASYLRSPKGKSLTPEETKAFSKVVRREGVENVLHNAGSRLANVGILGAGAASTPFTGIAGPIASGVAVGGNLLARKLSEVSTDRKIKDALKTVLAGRTAQTSARGLASALTEERKARLIRALMGGLVSSGVLEGQKPVVPVD